MSITALIISAALTAATPASAPQADPHADHHPEQPAAMQPAKKMGEAGCPMMKNGMGETGQMGDHHAMMQDHKMMAGEGMHAKRDCVASAGRRHFHRHHKRPPHR